MSGTNVDITEYHLYNSTVATNDFRSYLNGGQHGADTSVTIDFAAGGANNLHVGARPSFSLDGRTAEHIFYSQQLTNSERQRVDSYLALKYGITLDQTSATDYVSSAGTGILMWDSSVSSFNNDIAGIGRDSGSDLDQRISKSVNDDALVTITTTNDFTSPNNDA